MNKHKTQKGPSVDLLLDKSQTLRIKIDDDIEFEDDILIDG